MHKLVYTVTAELLDGEFDQPEIIAVTGWTTAELMQGIAAKKPMGPFDLVSLLIGVNNQYRSLSEDEYASEFTELLQKSITFANGKPEQVVVISIPDWGNTPFAKGRDTKQISSEIDRLNKLNYDLAMDYNVHYVNITDLSRLEEASDMLVNDQLHYSGEMYRLWAERIYNQLFSFHQRLS